MLFMHKGAFEPVVLSVLRAPCIYNLCGIRLDTLCVMPEAAQLYCLVLCVACTLCESTRMPSYATERELFLGFLPVKMHCMLLLLLLLLLCLHMVHSRVFQRGFLQ